MADSNKSIKLDNTRNRTYFNRGLVFQDLEKYQKAINDFSTSLSMKSKQHRAHFDRGICYYYIDDYKASIKDYKKALKYNSNSDPFEKMDLGEVYDWMRASYEELGLVGKAKKAGVKAKKFGYISE